MPLPLVARRAGLLLVVAFLPRVATAGVEAEVERQYRVAVARSRNVGDHLAQSLESTNRVETLFALEHLRSNPQAASPGLAPRLAALAVDRTPVRSLKCLSCEIDCPTCSGCWGMYGHSDCHPLRELGAYARLAISAVAAVPVQQAIADSLWPLALRSEADATLVATLVPRLHPVFRPRLHAALATAAAPTALRLLMAFPPGACGGDELRPALERLMSDPSPITRWRAATSVLACAAEEPAWKTAARAAVAVLTQTLARTDNEVLRELPAVAGVVRPLVAPVGRRMARADAKDAREGARLLHVVAADAAPALPGLEARLVAADLEEAVQLLEIAQRLGTKARPLKRAVIVCVGRDADTVHAALEALKAMRTELTPWDRTRLGRAWERACALEECEPLSRVLPP